MTLENAFNKTVFLLGAGASVEAGCKMSSQMLENLTFSINTMSVEENLFEYIEDFKEIHRIIYSSLEYQSKWNTLLNENDIKKVPNIEDYILTLRKILNKPAVIPMPLVGSWSEQLLKLEIHNPNIFSIYYTFIVGQIIKWLNIDDNKNNDLLQPISKLLQSTIDENININLFSLNYDLSFESFFNQPDCDFVNDGFSNSIWNNKYFTSPDKPINLYKLHGSLNWDNNNEIIEVKSETVFNIEPFKEPHFILGLENKLFSVDPFFSMFQEFINKIENANLIICIGYSFFDTYLNNIIIKYLSKDESKKLLIVDPTWKDKSSNDFVKYVEGIQANKSTLNLQNLLQFPSAKIEIFNNWPNDIVDTKKYTEEFYNFIFKNKAEYIVNTIDKLNILDNPF